MADKLRPDELAAFKAAFDMFDKNQDGTISTKVSTHIFFCIYLTVALDKTNQMVKDAVFRTTCSQGYFSKRKKTDVNFCKFVHHHDNYLKLGPFKVCVI